MGTSGKGNLLSTIAAVICIILYAVTITYGAGRILANYEERGILAETEFRDVQDRVSSAAVLGFMSGSYQIAIQDSILDSTTILGVIISGSNGEFAFERQPGTVINWVGTSPRFKTGFGISSDPHIDFVRIEGQRNTTVQTIHSMIDYDYFINVLKETLIIIFAVLALSIFVLLIELNLKNMKQKAAVSDDADYTDNVNYTDTSGGNDITDFNDPVFDEPVFDDPDLKDVVTENSDFDLDTSAGFDDPAGFTNPADIESDNPRGLYSTRGIGWENYLKERLESELHRCAASEEDLVLIAIDTAEVKLSEESFNELINECVSSFTLRDMIFEKGVQGLSLMVPALGLDNAISKAEEFRNKICSDLKDLTGSQPDLRIGLSSRAGRLVEADRLMLEAYQALEKAMDDQQSFIIAFKSDPEKYRKFISQGTAS